VVPVSDVDKAKDFYHGLGWRLDANLGKGDFRVVQLTPPGSACSVIFGAGITPAGPGSAQGMQLTVTDIDTARADLASHGVEVFHNAGGCGTPPDTQGTGTRAGPDHKSYGLFVFFSDPDGNIWFVQEITTRRPGR
jgi:catechol 2,3-dioxygenase-like lactoylglutathione lyase family enzyme